jgi:urea carboxylase-associated protein 2
MTTDLDEQTPEQHRARYEALKAQARAKEAARPLADAGGRAPPTIASDAVLAHETIAGGWYWSARVTRGQTLRLLNTAGNPGVSVLIWNADDTSERYNAGDTVKLQWTTRLTRGRVLFSDMGRVLCSITEDGFGASDTILGGSTPTTNARNFGDASLRNSRDNFLLAAGKLGLRRPDVPPAITFFAEIGTDEDGRFHWKGGAAPGDIVDLRAEMNVIVTISNCPHPLAPGGVFAPGPIEAVLWQGPPPAPDDLCRSFTEEAVRGFENTDSLFAPRHAA